MTYFAQLDANKIVLAVHVVTAEYMEANPELYPGVWVETFLDDPTKTYAGIGFTYNAKTKDFTPPTIEPAPLP
jgi:hypothetical protein